MAEPRRARSSARSCTTSSAATPRCGAPRCCGCARPTSARSSTPTACSPAWPLTYDDLAPWYDRAERLYQVHGRVGSDPTDPPRGEFPYPPVQHEAEVEWAVQGLRDQGLHPSYLPLGLIEPGHRRLRAVQHLQLLPVPGAREVRHRRGLRDRGRQGRQRRPVDRRPRRAAGHRPLRRPRHRGRRTPRRRDDPRAGRHGRAQRRRGELGRPAARQRHRPAPRRAGQQQRAGRPQLHGPPRHDDGGDAPAAGEPDRRSRRPSRSTTSTSPTATGRRSATSSRRAGRTRRSCGRS